MPHPGTTKRNVRVAPELWEAYARTVGADNRGPDIRAYMQWRINNPDTPLPGQTAGPDA